MKTILKITALAVLLGASHLATAQTPETAPNPIDPAADNEINYETPVINDDSGKWGLAGLLGLLGLLGMRRNRVDHHENRGPNTR